MPFSVNPMELVMEALSEVQRRFYQDFPPHPEEARYIGVKLTLEAVALIPAAVPTSDLPKTTKCRYSFATPSTMKPTQFSYPGGSINQIPGEATICGDCRITPFYEVEDVMAKLRTYVDDINAHIADLPSRGPCSKYEVRGPFITCRSGDSASILCPSDVMA